MSAAAELIERCRAAGLSLAIEGDALHVDFERDPPVELIEKLRQHKYEVIVALVAGDDWRARHREALAYWGAVHSAAEAARLAWGEMQWRWQRLHGARAPEWRCAGCGEPIGVRATLDLADGNRVHLDTLDCLLAFGERWRSEANVGLQALGLDPPAVLG